MPAVTAPTFFYERPDSSIDEPWPSLPRVEQTPTSDAPFIGTALTPSQRNSLEDLARDGHAELSRRVELGRGQQVRSQSGLTTAGFEAELVIVDSAGSPHFRGRDIVDAQKELERSHQTLFSSSPSLELGGWNVEINSAVTTLGRGVLFAFEQHLAAAIQRINLASSLSGGRVVSAGIVPSIFEQHCTEGWMTRHQRYADLGAGLADYNQRFPHHVRFRIPSERERQEYFVQYNPAELQIGGPSGVLSLKGDQGHLLFHSAGNTSLQIHCGMAIDDYVLYHRLADLIAPILTAACASSPFVFGQETGFEENRLLVYLGALHLRRVIPPQWIEDPLGQLKWSIERGAILGPAAGKGDDSNLTPIKAARLLQGTAWPLTRTVIRAEEVADEVRLWIEGRGVGAQATVIDSVAAGALFWGLLAGLPQYLADRKLDLSERTTPQKLSELLPYYDHSGGPCVMRNIAAACLDGVNAKIRWIDGRDYICRELLQDQLLGVAAYGLGLIGEEEGFRDRYLNVIRRRLEGSLPGQSRVGVTPASVIQALANSQSLRDLRPDQRFGQVSLLLSEALQKGMTGGTGGIWDWYCSEGYRAA